MIPGHKACEDGTPFCVQGRLFLKAKLTDHVSTDAKHRSGRGVGNQGTTEQPTL
eukprot:CAMPEP_0194539384 /NCGR_PEP_ID=MMETSP0253-20130528/79329_1 /TAXON_ID=2966 /ORGANISM="Noctiluca scintillans" /LENGTH=53 /DNA_ID=CAMNT_0039385661 /DNA_START=527 /DNA_END=684 /DNA_ORIENTATION=-